MLHITILYGSPGRLHLAVNASPEPPPPLKSFLHSRDPFTLQNYLPAAALICLGLFNRCARQHAHAFFSSPHLYSSS